MKTEKVFVRYKNLEEAPAYNQQRNSKRPYDKKKYTEKQHRSKQGFKMIYDSYQPLTDIPQNVKELIKSFPKFFNLEGKTPEKDNNQLLNEYLIFNAKKFLDSLKDVKKQSDMLSSSDPEWNSDEEVDCNMKSKIIDQNIVEKVVEKMRERPTKQHQILKPHQKNFLEDYFRKKRQELQQQQQLQSINASEKNDIKQKSEKNDIKQIKPAQMSQYKQQKAKTSSLKPESEGVKQEEKTKLIWSEYQQRQLNTFVDLGFMTKIDQNEEQIQAEVIEDDDLFNDQMNQPASNNKSNQSSSSEEDDIFGDQHPTTTTVKAKEEKPQPKQQSDKQITKGTVFINDHIFSNIAQSLGYLPSRCSWIIKNEITKYKVTTDYMDAYYRKEKMYEILPYISLNHSQFVNNDKIEAAEGLQMLRDFNYRRNQNRYQQQPRPKYQYREKPSTHSKKN